MRGKHVYRYTLKRVVKVLESFIKDRVVFHSDFDFFFITSIWRTRVINRRYYTNGILLIVEGDSTLTGINYIFRKREMVI